MEHGYTGSEAKLFLYFLRHAAEVGPTFSLSDRQAGAMVGISEKVFKAARNRLHDTGLVVVDVGGAGGRGSRTRYELAASSRKKGGQKVPPLLPELATGKGGEKCPPFGMENGEKGGQKVPPFQERKVSPLYPPSKERNSGAEQNAHAQGSGDSTVNPQIRPPTEEEVKAFAALAGIDPQLAITAAEGLAAIGWIDKYGRAYLDWRSPVKQGAQMRANDKAKSTENRNGTARKSGVGAGTTATQRQRDFANTPLDESAFRGFEASLDT